MHWSHGQWDHMDWGEMSGWGWAGWLMPGLTMLIVLGALALLITLLARRPDHRTPDTAGRILAERFARGEIDVDEYQRRQEALRR